MHNHEMIGALLALAIAADAPRTAPQRNCALTHSDYLANSALSFDDFDQAGTLPSTARKLGNRGCWKEAAAATADYLMRGPVPTPSHQRVLLFHLGQQLALAGDESQGAVFIAATRSPPSEVTSDLDWNDYVLGTWAFLTKDRYLLRKSRDAVLAAGADGDRINGGILAALERCFDRPYAVAYDLHCGHR